MSYTPPGVGSGSASVLLDYAASTDIANGVACTADTWIDIGTNQSFTVTDNSKIITISATGFVLIGITNGSVGVRLVIDSAGTPIYKQLGGVTAVTTFGNAMSGAGTVNVTGLSNGLHTVKLQVYSAGNGSAAYCRASTNPNTESLAFLILQQ